MTLCKNPYEEAEFVAIKLLENHADGIDFSNMAVIMRDAEGYKGIINSVFEKYNIPYFYSEKTDICTTSASRYILSSLRAIATNFRLDDMLTLVKTGLCPISDEECDMFEDYCTTWKINGSGFTAGAFHKRRTLLRRLRMEYEPRRIFYRDVRARREYTFGGKQGARYNNTAA